MNQRQFVIEEVTDPAEVARHKAGAEAFRRNLDWLKAHWNDVLPQAHGKFLAVAGQEAHVADSIEEALAWAKRVHPEDQGFFLEYVRPPGGPRIYAHRWRMVPVR